MSTYFGTWMISTIGKALLDEPRRQCSERIVISGETIGVPDTVMGMVFMAAGGSVVEVYAVYYKVRRGQ